MSSNYNPPHPHQSPTPTPFQSFTKSFISFGKALILFFLVTHFYMILFLVIPNQGSGSRSGSTKGQVVVLNTTKPEPEISSIPPPPTSIERQSIVLTKEKEPLKPKERPIQIQTVTVEKVRDELTQEQLQRIHTEFQNELSSSSSSSSSSNHNNGENIIINGNIYNQRINALQNLLDKVTHTRNFNKQILDKTNDILQKSQPSKLFDPKVQSLMKHSMHRLVSANPGLGGERKVAQIKEKYDEEQVQKIKIDTLISFLKRDWNYRDMEVDQLKNEVLKPIEKEFEMLLEMYGNGDFGIRDIGNAFANHGIDLNSYTENKCDRNYLKIDSGLYEPNLDHEGFEEVNEEREEKNEEEEKEEKEEQEEHPEDGIYATKNHLSNYIRTVQQDLEKHFSEALAASNSESLNILIRNEKQSTLKEKAIETLRQRFNHASQNAKSKFDSFSLKLRNFQTSIENYKNLGIPNTVPYDEEELCTQVDEVEDIMMFAVKYVERLGMEVNDVIKLIIENFNQQNDEEYHINYEEIIPLPEFVQPEFLNNVERRETFKELMNTPMVHASIKSLNQGIDIISGYSDALDRLIDFIAGFSKSDNNGDGDEEGTVGESIENGLVRLLNNFNMPKQMSEKHGKAGILR